MKKLFALIAVVLLASCSGGDDDDNKVIQKFVTSFATNDGLGDVITTLQYDENKNLKSVTEEGDLEWLFEYDNTNSLTAINYGDGSPYVTIQYENGKLSSYTTSGGIWPITFNEQTQKYIFSAVGLEASIVGKDLKTVNETGGNTTLDITYGDKKGPFYNVQTKNTFLLSLLLNMYYYVSTKPILGVKLNQGIISAENTYDEDGYITKMILTMGNDPVLTKEFTFHYSEL